MDELVELWERPVSAELYMLAGWRQWADAGNVSSGLPRYLIEQTGARRIGQIKAEGFYIYQIPGTHHFLRPTVALQQGYRKSLERKQNELFFTGDQRKGLLLFLGDEPHMNIERYAQAFLDIVQELGVRRVVALGGVYGAMPYDKEREVSCAYSLWGMQKELHAYAVRFSDYEGGSTIGTEILDRAEARGIEFIEFYAFVPAYDFSEISELIQGMRIDNDFKAWYELMRRINHMFDLRIDLSELEQQAEDLVTAMHAKIEQLDRQMPQLNVKAYMERVSEEFIERPFMPLDDMWEQALGDLFEDREE